MTELVKIAFVMPWHISERGGGAEVQANYLAQSLIEKGYEVNYVCQTAIKQNVGKQKKIGRLSICFVKSSTPLAWLDQWKYLKPLREFKPDYIVQRNSSNVTYVLANYCKKKETKFIWICTDNFATTRDYLFVRFKRSNTIKNLGIIRYTLLSVNYKFLDLLRNKGMTKIDIGFSQNDFQKLQLYKQFNINTRKIYSGHPVSNKHYTAEGNRSKKTILWCANFGKHKRPEIFLELASKMLETNYQFIMVGGHSNEIYEKQLLRNRAKNLKVTGSLSYEESLNYFDSASLLINTSLSEGFSNTYIQAWMRGIPTIVFGADPSNTIAQNQLGGVVDSIEQAKELIIKLLEEKDIYLSYSNRAHRYGLKNHTIERMTEDFLREVMTNP